MKIYLEQIPEECDISDYPEETEIVFVDDRPLKRDPKTFQLLPRERLPLVYPDDVKQLL